MLLVVNITFKEGRYGMLANLSNPFPYHANSARSYLMIMSLSYFSSILGTWLNFFLSSIYNLTWYLL